MVIEKNKVFNLMDTNGRRSDVLNALKIYLEILAELKLQYPSELWKPYPVSIKEFLFYEKALERSEDVFKIHTGYDEFISVLGTKYQSFVNKNDEWIKENFLKNKALLDEAVEQRARHYTSTLVKMGFTDADREITEAGNAYLKGQLERDIIEELLPLDNINIVLLRQLMKLKVFTTPDSEGKRKFYSPFFMALNLLSGEQKTDRRTFEIIVQGLNPYCDENLKKAITENSITIDELELSVRDRRVDVPEELSGKCDIEFSLFEKYFKSSKDNDGTRKKYYDFFSSLFNFRENKTAENYESLLKCFEKNGAVLEKAFGFGKMIFDFGRKDRRYTLEEFIEKNSEHHLLTSDAFVESFYTDFSISKWLDGIKEYSDTTIRLLSAVGLFSFKNSPELSFSEIISVIFDSDMLNKNIFGELTEKEFLEYEGGYFCKNTSIGDILSLSEAETEKILKALEYYLGVSGIYGIKKVLSDKKHEAFIKHIDSKYPKEKIMELLKLFSDRKNDPKIKKAVNDSASVPTIYEYIIGIAWYYISGKSFDLYNSLNLTMSADFEPIIHAGGGEGDIVIDYEDIVLMLEVTLMKKYAQKRGEWEPVLRHSLNLKAAKAPKETITFFIADELDYNTINIWRAVAAVQLESTDTHKKVDGVVIMPFTNKDIYAFLDNNTPLVSIINNVKASFLKIPKITDNKWREDVLHSLHI